MAISLTAFAYLTPYLSILNFKSALEKNNYENASGYINFPSIRRSLKQQITENVSKAYSREIRSNPYAAFGMVFLEPVVDRIVDMTVTPSGLKILLNQGLLASTDEHTKSNKNIQNSDKLLDNKDLSSKDLYPQIRMYYYDFDTFVLSSIVKRSNEPIISYWKRYGFFKWRLNSLSIPHELLKVN